MTEGRVPWMKLLPFILFGMAVLYLFSYTLLWLQGKRTAGDAATDAFFLAALTGIVLFVFWYRRLKRSLAAQ